MGNLTTLYERLVTCDDCVCVLRGVAGPSGVAVRIISSIILK